MMSKIRLDVDSLAVRSFATEEAAAGRGTVRGHDVFTDLCPAPTERLTCARERTAYETCYVNCECTNRQILCKA